MPAVHVPTYTVMNQHHQRYLTILYKQADATALGYSGSFYNRTVGMTGGGGGACVVRVSLKYLDHRELRFVWSRLY